MPECSEAPRLTTLSLRSGEGPVIADSRPVAILIAEADQLVRMVTADMLSDVGFQTIEVRTAAEALAVLEGPAAVRMLITGRSIVGDGVDPPLISRTRGV